MNKVSIPLSNVQLELMKLYSTDLTEKELIELKEVLSKFYSDRSIQAADRIWDEKKLSDADMDVWLNLNS